MGRLGGNFYHLSLISLNFLRTSLTKELCAHTHPFEIAQFNFLATSTGAMSLKEKQMVGYAFDAVVS